MSIEIAIKISTKLISNYVLFIENFTNAILDSIIIRRRGDRVDPKRLLNAIIGNEKLIPLKETEIDERIEKLDDVQSYLKDAIVAVEELKSTANENKNLQSRIIKDLEKLKADHKQAKHEASAIKEATKADIDAFKKIAGIPSEKEIRKSKIFGFFSGVLASILAAIIIYAITEISKKYITPLLY